MLPPLALYDLLHIFLPLMHILPPTRHIPVYFLCQQTLSVLRSRRYTWSVRPVGVRRLSHPRLLSARLLVGGRLVAACHLSLTAAPSACSHMSSALIIPIRHSIGSLVVQRCSRAL